MTDICKAETVGECTDKYADYEESEKKQVGIPLNADTHFKWQKHADEYFYGRYSQSKHPGQISNMAKKYIKACMDIVNESNLEGKDPDDFVREAALDSGSLLRKKEELEEELDEKEVKIKELERKLDEKETEKQLAKRTGAEKLRYAVRHIVKQETKTKSEIVDEIKEIGISKEEVVKLDFPKERGGEEGGKTREIDFDEAVGLIVEDDPYVVKKGTREVNDYLEFTEYGYEDQTA
ncbi:MAG: hypothetical protein ABEJ98_03595 [Candidatus Nanohaloarchaea archaeon]